MLNIAPFAYETDADDDSAIELRWEEPRDLVRIVLRLPAGAALPPPATVSLAY